MELLFQENGFLVKTLSAPEEMDSAFRLRHEVFAGELGWVPPSEDGLERDRYDGFSESIGVFDERNVLVGHLRMTPPGMPFMVDREFSVMVPEGVRVFKGPNVAEVTRLCVERSARSADVKRGGRSIPDMLYKGMYHWSLHHGVDELVIVVDRRCLRHLKITGLPVEPSFDFVIMPDGVEAGVCRIFWRRFDEAASAGRRKRFREWAATMPDRYPSLSRSHGPC